MGEKNSFCFNILKMIWLLNFYTRVTEWRKSFPCFRGMIEIIKWLTSFNQYIAFFVKVQCELMCLKTFCRSTRIIPMRKLCQFLSKWNSHFVQGKNPLKNMGKKADWYLESRLFFIKILFCQNVNGFLLKVTVNSEIGL